MSRYDEQNINIFNALNGNAELNSNIIYSQPSNKLIYIYIFFVSDVKI